jgi:hypothetical protein
VPITFDEVSASTYYPKFTFKEIILYPGDWPSNHVLNTLFIKASESVFGIEPWSVRLPNMLAFVFIFWIIYLLAAQYFNKSVALFFLPFAIVFCNPFLLDFFGLARGYGLSNAFMAGSVFCLLRYTSSFAPRWYFLTVVLSMMAAYANFTLLLYWVAVQGVLIVALVAGGLAGQIETARILRILIMTLILAAGFMALCYMPLYKMQSTNQFMYWSKTGFYTDTLLDQVARFRYGLRYWGIPDFYAADVVLLLLTITGISVVYKIFTRRLSAIRDPLVVSFLLLLSVWIVNMAQTIILGTPYLNGRTALSYYVLFAFVLMFLVRDLAEGISWFKKIAVPPIIVFFCLHLILAFNLRSVQEWDFDANTYRVLDYIHKYQKMHPDVKTVDLNTTWIFNPSFSFYVLTGKVPWLNLIPMQTTIDTASQTQFYYVMKDDVSALRQCYTPVLVFDNGPWLMKKK